MPHDSPGSYPLWVGVIALGLFGGLWAMGGAGPPALSDAGVDAMADAAADAGPPIPVLAWLAIDGTLPTSGALGRCLREGAWDRFRVLGRSDGLTVTHSTLRVPIRVVAADGGAAVRTPLAGARHLALKLHSAVAACIPEATALEDPVTGRHGRDAWPSAARDTGLPLGLIVKTAVGEGFLYTDGLSRLGLADVLVVGEDAPPTRRLLAQAAVAVLVADDPAAGALTVGGRPAQLLDSPAWRPDGADPILRAVAGPNGQPLAAPPAPVRAPVTRPAQARPTLPRSPTTRPPRRIRPKPRRPTFRPEYR